MTMRRDGSLRGYARHRAEHGLPGQTLRAVQRAIESGRIQVEQGQIPDYAAADAQWQSTTRPQPLSGEPIGNQMPDDELVRMADAQAVDKRRELTLWACLGDAMRAVAPKVAATSDRGKVLELLNRALEGAHLALEADWRRWVSNLQTSAGRAG